MEHILDKNNINKDKIKNMVDDFSNTLKSTVDTVFGSLSGHIIKLDNNLYVAKEFVDAKLPTQENESAGWDLYAYETVTILPGEYKLIPIGCRITVDEGWWYSIYPRSSLDFKKSVAPKPGSVFDATYTGNMDIKMYNNSTHEYTIKKYDKFCQVVVHKKYNSKLCELTVSELENLHKEGRGNKGWGSSGK